MNTVAVPPLSDMNLSWLRERGQQRDRDLADLVNVLDLRLATRLSPTTVPMMAADALTNMGALRKARTRKDSIGSLHADRLAMRQRDVLVRPFLMRLGVVVCVASVSASLLASWAEVVLLTLASALLYSFKGSTYVSVSLGVAVVVLQPERWLLVFVTLQAVFLVVVATRLGRVLRDAAGPGLGFLPLRDVALLCVLGSWPNYSLGLDKALGDDFLRAEDFLVAGSRRVPRRYEPVTAHARGLVLARRGRIGDAMAALAVSRPDPRLSRETRGWCDLVFGDVLLLAGQTGSARTRYEQAADALASRRSRGARVQAELRIIDLAIRAGDFQAAVERIVNLRWTAVRTENRSLLEITEGHVARLMLGIGNTSGAEWVLESIVPVGVEEARNFETRSSTAVWSIVYAELLSNRGDLDGARRHAELAYARASMAGEPAIEAVASVVRADVLRRSGEETEALGLVVSAIDVLQRVRYTLPSSNWRANWLKLYARAYEIALDLAARRDDAMLVAEILEAIKSQAVPVSLDAAAHSLIDLLSALLDPLAVVTALDVEGPEQGVPAAVAATGVDPARPSVPVRIGGDAWLSTTPMDGFDLETELDAQGRGWYWSACLAVDAYWWAVRDAGGTWSWGRSGLARGSKHRANLDTFVASLPVRRPGETAAQFYLRLGRSPLVAWEPSRERELLSGLATAFLPERVADGLRRSTGAEPRTLVVSLPGLLSLLPVNGLPLAEENDLRVIDRACVVHAPVAAVTALARLRPDELEEPDKPGAWPLSLAVIDPDPARDELVHARGSSRAAVVVSGPATKERIRQAMASACEPRSVLHIAGHYASPDPGVPASGGLSVDGGVLSLRDLIDRGPDGVPVFRLPRRVLLSLCESLGAGASEAAAGGDLDVTAVGADWLGLAAGAILAGATDVVATTWPLLEDETTARLDDELARALGESQPSLAVRDVLLGELRASRDGSRPVLPAVWLSYCYLGVGRTGCGST